MNKKNFGRNLSLWVVVIVLVMLVVGVFRPETEQSAGEQINYTQFMDNINADKIKSVVIQDRNLNGKYKDGKSFTTYLPPFTNDLLTQLANKNVTIESKPLDNQPNLFWRLIINLLPTLLIIGLFILLMRNMQGAGGKAMGFGKSKAKMLTEKQGRVTFADVAGIDEAKAELEEIVEFLKDSQKFQRLGGKIPKGVLLVGPPGTGKTLLARAIAGEANVPFFTISGSDFVEMFVGVGASRVRDMFEQGKKNAPCIIFIDEIDAVGRHRGMGMGGGNDEREQTLNQMLVEMDGFDSNESVILIAATNRPDVLDPALLRPGRFDRQVMVPNPDVVGREKILRVHMRNVPLASDVDPKVIARGTPGFSGADLANLVNEAALLAARLNRRTVSMIEFENAKDKVMMGAERRSLVMSDEEKRNTAYHEAGHALCALLIPGCDPVHKATIIPRGRALGMVMSLPEGDRYSETRLRCKARLVLAMGGRCGEELAFGPENVTSGASGDIKMATNLARNMVTEWGMSEKLGMINYDDKDQGYMGQSNTVSGSTIREIEIEVKQLVDEAYERAMNLLIEHREQWERLAKGLLEYETLNADEIQRVLRGEKIERSLVDDSTKNLRSSVPEVSSEEKTESTTQIKPEVEMENKESTIISQEKAEGKEDKTEPTA
ncbi:ATP-dependent zinc metalloprotease FtsH [Commensalibacter papalotli (ex Botero et al. 2024)]|uniref:ATP-dependent zinc metalloprotease FtsH n=1 Tax=Commensalibacter papalotli (ex Botero et al. 2024) TaxID=2972766 RepID=A0ABN8WET6_9PROT|nr:ATP-dependent zinc metalloprotease FtsH [Commensalibacter papalotli (ex Botero et al. 2024)]CAI3933067.1 ATP-dependent Zn proteases (HflB) (PDB:1LV7) [Commensalibacter papalotli (ex Botero et al. 2024)]CAI3942623.1 ATP-dependent Zn proteases (HflB) (PDB:1LV7) [Commensalibacter papalotli (ex Botero et al. 2024)]